MTIKTIELKELKAAEGMVLTNGEAYSEIGGSVYLGINDKPENWHEITDEEYNKILDAQNLEEENGRYN